MGNSRNIYYVHDDGRAELKCGDYVILLDSDDVDLASRYQWSVGIHGYATHGAGRDQILMHRLLLGANDSEVVDHINRNRLDNRRKNLRICSQMLNVMNKSRLEAGSNPFKGICRTADGMWQAQITFEGKQMYLGRSSDPVVAAKAYDTAARVLCGEFAYLNFPDSDEHIELPVRRRTKLTSREVSCIRNLYHKGLSIRDISAIYDHSYSSINRIINYRTFREEVTNE